MGSVHAARDHELDEEIAIKVLHSYIASMEGALDRFRREVKLARRVTHANVARTYDLGQSDGVCFITMELLVGESLSARIDREQLGLADALRITADIAQGLAAAHMAGVVHRDLKPDNVIIDVSGAGPDGGERTVITDFGIAVLTAKPRTGGADAAREPHTVAGTPAYMAPEQLEGKEQDGRTDVYALGVILFELLTRRAPFVAEDPYALAVARLTQDPLDPRDFVPDLPEPVVRLIRDMLARPREARPDTAAVIERLEALRGNGRVRSGTVRRFDLGEVQARVAARAPTLVVIPRIGPAEARLEAELRLAEGVADALAAHSSIRAIAPSVVRARLAASPESIDPAVLLRELGASHWLEVSLDEACPEAGTRARVRIGDASLALVASEVVEGADAARAAVDVAARAGRALAGSSAASATGARAKHPVDPRAAALYQEAMAELTRFGLDHTLRAVEILHRAEAIVPDDPFVASALGAALVKQWSFQGERALLGQAEEHSLRALAANPHIGETFNTIGILRLHQGDLRAAVRAFEEASARSPELAEPHSYVGRLLSEAGRTSEAEARLALAMRLDPDDQYAPSELSRIAALNGDFDRADALLEDALARNGQRIVRATQARYALWRGDMTRLNELITEIDRSEDPAFSLVKRVFVPIWRAFVVGDVLGPEDPRLGLLETTASGTSMRMTTFWNQMLAETYARLGQAHAAIASIEKAVGRALVDVRWLDRCVLLDDLRADARFARARTATASRAASLWR